MLVYGKSTGRKKQGFLGIPPAQNCLFICGHLCESSPARFSGSMIRGGVFLCISVFSRLLRKFPESAHTLRRTQTLTTVGLFLAIQMVLSSYGTIQVNDSLKISLAHLRLPRRRCCLAPSRRPFRGL